MNRNLFLTYSNNYFKNKKKLKLQILFVYTILFFLLFFSISISASFLASTKKIFSTKDSKFLTIIPKDLDIGIFKIDTPKFLGKGVLSESDVLKISKIPKVSKVVKIYTLKSPANIYGKFFDMSYGTDLNIFGNNDVFKNYKIDSTNIREIPAIVSNKLLDIYNISFAPANGLPKLTEKIFIGRTLNLRIGVNSFSYKKENMTVKLKIIGLSNQVDIFGVTIPNVLMKKIASKIKSKSMLSSIRVYSDNASDLVTISNRIKNLGYKIRTKDNKLFENINKYINKFDYLINAPILLFLLVILIFIKNQLNYLLSTEKKEMGIQLAYGMYSRDLIYIWLMQYLKLIVLGITLGFTLGMIGLNSLFRIFLSDLKGLLVLDYCYLKQLSFAFFILIVSLFFIYIILRKYFIKNSIVSLIKNI